MFSRYGTPEQYRAKLEYDKAFVKALRLGQTTPTDPKLRKEHAAAWAAAVKAEQKLKWWQTRAVN